VTTAAGVLANNVIQLILFRANTSTSMDIIINNVKTPLSLGSAVLTPNNRITWGGIKQSSVTNTFSGNMDEAFFVSGLVTDAAASELFAAI
jgi:hypothetical protein